MDDSDFPVKGCVIAIVAAFVFISAFFFIQSNFTYRVDPGKVGLLVNYTQKAPDGTPKVTVIPQSTFVWYNSWGGQAMFEYSVSLQTLTMVAKANEGGQSGDDSVSFLTQEGIPLKVDMNVQWRVTNPERLYFLMPGIPLDGSFNNDVSSKLVRQSVIHALNTAGPKYAWQDIASNEDAIEQSMLTELTPIMARYGVTIEQVSLGQPHYSTQQQSSIDAVTKAQQDALTAQFSKQKEQYLADAAKIQAQSQAQQIQIINQQLAQSPDYIQYLMVKMYQDKWDGSLPSTLSTDGKGSLLAPFQK